VLELTAANRQTTYDRITYWVSVRRSVAVQADFLSLSGKKLKSAQFEYGNSLNIGGSILFVSRMAIADALSAPLVYSRIKAQAIPSFGVRRGESAMRPRRPQRGLASAHGGGPAGPGHGAARAAPPRPCRRSTAETQAEAEAEAEPPGPSGSTEAWLYGTRNGLAAPAC
jgi:hypothetical protein